MSSNYQYSLVARNDSSNPGAICVYQTNASLAVPGVMSLAWLTKRVNPTTQVVFRWNIEYSFAWYETGQLGAGILCVASQIWPADLEATNQVSFIQNASGFTFLNQTAGPNPANLYIQQNGTIPLDKVSVGIGVSGAGTFVTQAQPNAITNFQSPSAAVYWITFGDYTQGDVLDVAGMTTPKAAVPYPANIYSMTAVLGKDNKWKVETTQNANAAILAAREGS
jgi:hypothetical protein